MKAFSDIRKLSEIIRNLLFNCSPISPVTQAAVELLQKNSLS